MDLPIPKLTMITYSLPLSTHTTSPGKMPAFVSLSCTRLCGEEDFRWRWRQPPQAQEPSGEADFS